MTEPNRLERFSWAASGALLLAGIAATGSCGKDEPPPVAVVKDCALDKLNAAQPGEGTVKVFVEGANALDERSKALETQMKDACNAVNKELGIADGTDAKSACNALATRISTALKQAGKNPPPQPGPAGPPTPWVQIFAPSACQVDGTIETDCLPTCSGGATCDVAAKCPTAQLAGSCDGTCTGGACAVSGAALPCVGECRGECKLDVPVGTPPAPGGPCAGECVGKCVGGPNSFLARCETGCSAGFLGKCGGTCDGKCDGTAIVAPGADAGPEAGADGPPGGADGNCKGICEGTCSSLASGSCAGGRCAGNFSGGLCSGTCIGTCFSTSTGCLTTCNGTCVSNPGTDKCTGVCLGGCSSALGKPRCSATVDCGANPKCASACKVKAAVKATCAAPTVVDVRVPIDSAVYDALRKQGGKLVAVLQEAAILKAAADLVKDTTTDEMKALGASSSLARVCTTSGSTTIDAAITRLTAVLSAGAALQGKPS